MSAPPLQLRSSKRKIHWKSKLVSHLLILVVFFGLCGAFISNVTGIPKLHYIPLFISILLVFIVSIKRQFVVFYCLATFLVIIAPLFASDKNSYLAYLSSLVLPILWFPAGTWLNLNIVIRGFSYLIIFLFVGFLMEFSNYFSYLFPQIYYNTEEGVGQRYGSFTINSLGLGYSMSILGMLMFALPKQRKSYFYIAICLILLMVANSRGGMITFVTGFALMKILQRRSSIRMKDVLMYMSIMTVIIFTITLMYYYNERFRSTFDWNNDQGNLGRLYQWNYCALKSLESPLGHGAGSMSPIGVDFEESVKNGLVLKSCESTMLQISFEYGIGVAAIYCTLIIRMLIVLWWRTRKLLSKKAGMPFPYFSLPVEMSVILAISFQQLMNQTLQSIWVGAIFFSLLGHVYWQLRVTSGPNKRNF